MSIESEEFFKRMLEFLPYTEFEYLNSINEYGELLETVVIEDIFMKEIIKIISENKNKKLLESIFYYFEDVSNSGDKHLLNIFSITVLEILGNDTGILEIAKDYMGPRTKELQIKADKSIERAIEY